MSEPFLGRRQVFVDASFVRALLDPADAEHHRARDVFELLVDSFQRGDTILVSHRGMVDAVGDARAVDVFKVCDVSPLRRHLRRDAARVIARNLGLGLDVDRAVALVMLRRERIAEIATFDPLYARLGMATLPPQVVTA